MTIPPYPENETCDRSCGRMAVYRVLDYRGYELAVCCRQCESFFLPVFEDARGEQYATVISDTPVRLAGP